MDHRISPSLMSRAPRSNVGSKFLTSMRIEKAGSLQWGSSKRSPRQLPLCCNLFSWPMVRQYYDTRHCHGQRVGGGVASGNLPGPPDCCWLPPNLELCSNSMAPMADPLVMIMSSMTNKSCCNSLLWLLHLTLPHPCWEQDSAWMALQNGPDRSLQKDFGAFTPDSLAQAM